MKRLYLDDARPTPQGYTLRANTTAEAIALLEEHRGEISAISFDHDLGHQPAPGEREQTGYMVLEWLERQVVESGYPPPATMVVHSSNASARPKMEAAIAQIYRLAERIEVDCIA